MKKETVFFVVLALAGLCAMFAIFASTPTAAPVAPAPVEPIIINLEVPVEQPAKFKVGDAVVVEGIPYDAKVVEVQGMAIWTNSMTGEEVVMRAYVVELTSPDGIQTVQIRVPEIVLTEKK